MEISLHGIKRVNRVQPTTAVTLVNSNPNRKGLIIRNNSTIVSYLGDITVTALTGFPLKEDEIFIDGDGYDSRFGGANSWYAITASGTGDIRTIEYV